MPQRIYFDVPKMGTLASPGTQNQGFRHSALLGRLSAYMLTWRNIYLLFMKKFYLMHFVHTNGANISIFSLFCIYFTSIW